MTIRTVTVLGTGAPSDPRRPNLPAGTSYEIVADRGTEMDVRFGLDSRLREAERPDHVQQWVAPTGAHDAYKLGEHTWHNSRVWKVTQTDGAGNNVWEPGVFGWTGAETPAIPDKLRNPLRALRPTVNSAGNVTQLKTALLSILDTLTGDA
jgi:hypothetical protein